LFVHGFGGDLHTWDTVWEAMAAEPAALRYDLRGFGQTVCRRPGRYKHADDLLTVLDASAIDSCDLVGVSMGGGVAINFALDHPDRVRNLVLISPGLVGWEWSAAWDALWQPIAELARAGNLDGARRLWWEHPLFDSTRGSAGGRALFESIMRFKGEQWIRDDHQLMLPDVERLHLLRAPTLLLTGGRDFEDFRLIADLIEASVAGLSRIDRPQLGHLLHLEDPEHCVREIGSFWRASSAQPALSRGNS
jgi:pimeloyl-ACP methyl ester carboxylesterase